MLYKWLSLTLVLMKLIHISLWPDSVWYTDCLYSSHLEEGYGAFGPSRPDIWTATSHRSLDFSSDWSDGHLTSFHFVSFHYCRCTQTFYLRQNIWQSTQKSQKQFWFSVLIVFIDFIAWSLCYLFSTLELYFIPSVILHHFIPIIWIHLNLLFICDERNDNEDLTHHKSQILNFPLLLFHFSVMRLWYGLNPYWLNVHGGGLKLFLFVLWWVITWSKCHRRYTIWPKSM